MEFVKKALNFVLVTVILTIVTLAITVGAGFVDMANVDVINALLVTASFVSLAASILLLVACLFGKLGKNKNFTLAFWINILMIVFDIVVIILNVVKVQIAGLTIGMNVADTVVTVLTFFFVIMACREAVPSLGKRSIVTASFVILGDIFMGIFQCLPNANNNDGAVALGVFGGLFFLTGCILFVILIIKAVHRFGK